MHFVTLYTFSTLLMHLLLESCHKSHWLSWLEVNYFRSLSTIWIQIEEFATTEFNWLKKCTLHIQTSVGSSRFLKKPIRNTLCFSDCIIRMKSRCWCQISPIRTSACGCSRLKLLRVLGYVIVRKYNEGIFWKVGRARFKCPQKVWLFNWAFKKYIYICIYIYDRKSCIYMFCIKDVFIVLTFKFPKSDSRLTFK